MEKQYREYYAAANGYSGFRTYFGEVFPKEKLLKIFILKGGPGTGKSTLMRKILNCFSEKGFDCEAIFCSSDRSSLDGIIIGGKVAIIDGTAPHEVDAKLPGALDEIVNLGEGWDFEKLEKSRSEIEELNKNKKQNYDSAYKYLSFSGNIHDYKIELLSECFDFDTARSFIYNIVKEFKKYADTAEKILVSSFSKDGYRRCAYLGLALRKHYSVIGNHGEAELFFKVFKEIVNGSFPIMIFPSPFDDKLTEGIYFKREKILFLTSSEEGEIINASDFLKKIPGEEIEFLNKNELEYLEKSKLYFAKASENHFLLEDIYKDAMDFNSNDISVRRLCERIEKILSY